MPNQTPLNPKALRAGAAAIVEFQHQDSPWKAPWGDMGEPTRAHLSKQFAVGVSAYLTAAQQVVNSVEELVTTSTGLALANAAFNEGMSAGIKACNESLEGEPFVKPVSPYRPEVKP